MGKFSGVKTAVAIVLFALLIISVAFIWFNASPANGKVVNTITVGKFPVSITFNPSGTLAYVVNAVSGTISVISAATITSNGNAA